MNSSEPRLAIIDERPLIATVVKQLSEAIKPGLKTHLFSEPSTEILTKYNWVAVIFDSEQLNKVLDCVGRLVDRPGYTGSPNVVKVACGRLSPSDANSVDYVIDLYEKPDKTIAALKSAIHGLSRPGRFGESRFDQGSIQSSSSTNSNRFIELNHRALTPRQIEVLVHAAQGLSSNEIAEVLNVSVNTVRGYVQEIFTRLNVRNIAHAVSAYLKMQALIDFEDAID